MIKEEIKLIKESPADLKKFGITIGIVLIIIGAVLFFYGKNSWIYLTAAGTLLIFIAFLYPIILKPLNKIWMIFAIILGWFMTRLILSIIYYFVLTPISLIARIVNKKFLILKIDGLAKTYWEERNKAVFNNEDYERQF